MFPGLLVSRIPDLWILNPTCPENYYTNVAHSSSGPDEPRHQMSGDRSQALAEELHTWIPIIIPTCRLLASGIQDGPGGLTLSKHRLNSVESRIFALSDRPTADDPRELVTGSLAEGRVICILMSFVSSQELLLSGRPVMGTRIVRLMFVVCDLRPANVPIVKRWRAE